jgi:hypothetical protein
MLPPGDSAEALTREAAIALVHEVAETPEETVRSPGFGWGLYLRGLLSAGGVH